jgi:hypothetical protein
MRLLKGFAAAVALLTALSLWAVLGHWINDVWGFNAALGICVGIPMLAWLSFVFSYMFED